MLIATLGLMIVVWGGLAALRAGLILVAISVMVKFITLPLFGVLGILRFVDRKKPNWMWNIFGKWILDGIAILAVIIVSFLPYWDGPETIEEMVPRAEPTLYPFRSGDPLAASSVAFSVTMLDGIGTKFSRDVLQFGSSAIFVVIVVWLGFKLWKDDHVSAILPKMIFCQKASRGGPDTFSTPGWRSSLS